MTRLSPEDTCTVCGSLLVHRLESGVTVPKVADYMCLKCGQTYRWTHTNPPRLTAITSVEKGVDDDAT